MPLATSRPKAGVILADNDALLRSILAQVLTDAGQQVFPAEDGVQAVQHARRFLARLVLLDLAMPRMDGLAACREIRALPDYADVPIVVLTGHDHRDLRATASEAGTTLFLTKPIGVRALLASLAPYLGLPTGPPPAAAVPVGLRAQSWTPRPEPRPVFGAPAGLAQGGTAQPSPRERHPSRSGEPGAISAPFRKLPP